MGWSKDILLARANRWSEKHGYPPVTESSLLKWRKEGLIPKPKPIGRGWGKGKAEEWSCLAYRRILKIQRFKGKGILHRRDQRLILWLAGNDIRLELIRRDLIEIWEASLKRIGRETGTYFRSVPKPTDRKINNLLPQSPLKDIAKQLDLNEFSTILIRLLEPAFHSDEFAGILKDVVYAFLNPDYQGLRNNLAIMLEKLPDTSPEKIIAEEELVYGVGGISGLLASSDEFFNPALETLMLSSDQLLLNVRDFVLIGNSFWKAVFKLIKAGISYDPKTFLGKKGIIFKPIAEGLLNIFETTDILTTPADKLTLFVYLLRRAAIRENDGEAYKKIVELQLDKVISWMADNFEIFADENIYIPKKIAIVQDSPLSLEIKNDILASLE